MITRILRHGPLSFLLLVLSLLAAASCSEVPVDEGTAHVIVRGNDTIKTPPDTVMLPPDTIALPPDTVTITRDTVIVQRDTVIQTVIHDSLRTDTLHVLDTVLLQRQPITITGTLRARISDSTVTSPLIIDTVATVLTIYLKNNKPDAISLRLAANFQPQYKQIGFSKINLTPQWCQVNVERCFVQGFGVWLFADPLSPTTTGQSGIGMLYRTFVGGQAQWLTPGYPYSWPAFRVQKVDTAQRTIDAYAVGTLPISNYSQYYPNSIALDSLKLRMSY